ncbi:hypothetical protein PIB30_104173 [Stylosanthes scabra]|uniref:Uncharacterized protein n=1 Tax=Stylosanthes scabra TaxID=79078 RepID=A0ABU6TXQ5_9FABA|nr:hypothetical protein [Stylosanthes scabra]
MSVNRASESDEGVVAGIVGSAGSVASCRCKVNGFAGAVAGMYSTELADYHATLGCKNAYCEVVVVWHRRNSEWMQWCCLSAAMDIHQCGENCKNRFRSVWMGFAGKYWADASRVLELAIVLL